MAKKQLYNTLPLVAIDLGSNSVRAMAAESIGPNQLHILGYEQSTKHPCVDRGVVVQTSSAGYMIGEVLNKLANRISLKEIPAAFTVLGGRSMQMVNVTSKRDQIQKRPVSNLLLQKMEDECKQKIELRNPNIAVLGVVPAYYILDGQESEERPLPTDKATLIEVGYSAFVGIRELEEQVDKSFMRAAKTLENTFIRQDALLSAFATENDSILTDGCAIVDFGAQTTTLSVYKRNQYITTRVIPLGSWNITRAIEQLGMSIQAAETLKCQYGYASPDEVETNLKMRIPNSNICLTSVELAQTIQMKLDEMLMPLLEDIQHYEERIRTVYITGGGSLLNGLIDYMQAHLSIPVMFGSHARLLDEDDPDEFCSPAYSSLIGALIMAADYRREHSDRVMPGDDGLFKKFKKQFEEKTLDLFSNQNE